jgi:hypothetical protein
LLVRKIRTFSIQLGAGVAALLLSSAVASAQTVDDPPANEGSAAESSADLAKKLSNPVASLISIPFQNNYDGGIGQNHGGWQYKLNMQPVIPFSLNANWNLISRTILPFVDQGRVIDESHQTGLADTVQSLFFSPKAPTSSGWIWGAGPVFLLPTATDNLLGAQKWGLGPTAVALTQKGPWTVGILANQIWSVAGRSNRSRVSSTFLQPFLTYTTRRATTFSVNTETTYDWVGKTWAVPVNLGVAQLFKPSETGLPMPIQLQLGYRFYADARTDKPRGGLRFNITLLFPR